jgi:hypothetical protein
MLRPALVQTWQGRRKFWLTIEVRPGKLPEQEVSMTQFQEKRCNGKEFLTDAISLFKGKNPPSSSP